MVLMVTVLGACSLDNSQVSSVMELEVNLTGDPAIDTSINSLPLEELLVLGLVTADQGAVTLDVSDTIVYSYVYGPLHDKRAVRGEKIAVSVTVNDADTNDVFRIAYGYSPEQLDTILVLSNTGYSYRKGKIDVASDALDKIYYKVLDAQGNEYFDRDGEAFWFTVFDYIFSYSFSTTYYYGGETSVAGFLYVNYSGPAVGEGMSLHFGWNDWQNVTNINMSLHTNGTSYYPANYGSIRLDVPNDAHYLDFVINGNGIWDNNDGQDYHLAVNPLVRVTPTSIYDGKRSVSFSYANGTLDDTIFAHYGLDGWNNVDDVKMYKMTYQGMPMGFHTGYTTVDAAASVLDLAFFNTDGVWENNYGMDWHFDIDFIKN